MPAPRPTSDGDDARAAGADKLESNPTPKATRHRTATSETFQRWTNCPPRKDVTLEVGAPAPWLVTDKRVPPTFRCLSSIKVFSQTPARRLLKRGPYASRGL